ncbi:LysR family transcriptional regulator [Altererythrobacter aerius]|uniref:LysR family transcriptional regulator n=1 Tax=Tsuneonella aeria TaxID=1837929 RepID=A0A6I4TB59_9SPHN|nr:LysR family transcriptional regulator [Tsuneonella aeria]MXO73618.1 LysR family transcriptional regulator [Tsuneonella aeria]
MPSWRGIEEFLAVVRHGSFTAAGEKLGVSKSFVSKTVQELEHRLGVQLLVRTTRRLSLTGAGKCFHAQCSEIQEQLAQLERSIGRYSSEPIGRLKVGLSDIFGSDFMSMMLAEFSRENPAVVIEVVAYLDEGEIAQERYDVVIRYGELPSSSLRARLFGYLSHGLCASPDYVARKGWPAGPDDLREHDCLTDLSGIIRFNGGAEVKVSPRWRSNSGTSLRGAVRQGLGIASLPLTVVRHGLADGSVIALEEEWSFYDRECWVVYSPGIMAASTRAFIDFLVRYVNREKVRPARAKVLASRY